MTLPYKALFLDISGVLYEGERVIEGAVSLVQEARERGLVLRFVTNTVSKGRHKIVQSLEDMGIRLDESELFTAPVAAKNYINELGLRPYVLIHEAVKDEYEDFDQSEPNAVLIGDAPNEMDYHSLNRAFQLCKQGASLIGIGMNKYYADEKGLNLDAGPFIRMLEWAADTKAVIMGKPNQAFYDQVVKSTPFEPSQCMMVGDDAEADVNAAISAGLQACLVRTGKYLPGDEEKLSKGAKVIDAVSRLFES